MKWFWRLLAILVLLAAGVWLWLALNPSPAKVIRGRLHQLADQVSFTSNESDITRLAKVGGITRFFATEVEVKLAYRDYAKHGAITSEMIQAGVASLRQDVPGGVKVEFLDINVTLAPDNDSATAELTMKVTTPGDNQFNVQEMKFALRKAKDQWFIYHVETVKTLK